MVSGNRGFVLAVPRLAEALATVAPGDDSSHAVRGWKQEVQSRVGECRAGKREHGTSIYQTESGGCATGAGLQKTRESFGVLNGKTVLRATLLLRTPTFNQPSSAGHLGSKDEWASPPAQESPVQGAGFPQERGATKRGGRRKDRGRTDVLPLLSGERANPSEAMEAAAALPSDPPPPPGSPCRTTASASEGGAQTRGWLEMLFSSLFYTQCPEKHFADI